MFFIYFKGRQPFGWMSMQSTLIKRNNFTFELEKSTSGTTKKISNVNYCWIQITQQNKIDQYSFFVSV